MTRRDLDARPASVLALILHAGEPTLSAAIHGINSQEGVSTRYMVWGNFSEQEANRRLFRAVWAERDKYDFFARVDADMELLHPQLLLAATKTLDRYPTLGGVTVWVDDWITQERIEGFHVWRTGARWFRRPPRLWVEMPRSNILRRLVISSPPIPLVSHADGVGADIVARSVLRKVLKVSGDGVVHTAKWATIRNVIELAKHQSNKSRLAAGLAVEAALKDPLTALHYAEGLLPLKDIHSFLDWAQPEIALESAETQIADRALLQASIANIGLVLAGSGVRPRNRRVSLKDRMSVKTREIGRRIIPETPPQIGPDAEDFFLRHFRQ